MSERLFTGFSEDFLVLLAENSMNDSKAYYETVKQQIKETSTIPMRNLCSDLSDQLVLLDSKMNLVPSKMVSRIRRDTRVAKNENMYRSNMWAMFMRDKYTYKYAPGMWFEVAPGGWSCGIGLFRSDPTFMQHFRDAVLNHPRQFSSALKSVLDSGAVVDLDQYKKPKPNTEKLSKNLQAIYNAKYLYFINYSDDLAPLFDGSIEDILSQKIAAYSKMYKFIISVVENIPNNIIEDRSSIYG